ncbi:unnamed protein product [Cercospora beticola]|nr:unnamed protein product [Cercospora beticola]
MHIRQPDSPTAGASVELCGALTRLVGVILGIDHEVGMDSPCTGALPIVQWTVAWSRVVLTQVMGLAIKKPADVPGKTWPAIVIGLFVAFGGVLFGYDVRAIPFHKSTNNRE